MSDPTQGSTALQTVPKSSRKAVVATIRFRPIGGVR